MILFTEKRINVIISDVVKMDTESDASIYVSTHTYREASVLADRFAGELSSITRVLQAPEVHGEAIEFFFNEAPEPINILAPYLGLIDEDCEMPCDLRVLCGYLHQLSMLIDFSNYIVLSPVVRKDVVFTKAMMRGWADSWDEIQMKLNLAEFDMEKLSLDTLAQIFEKLGLTVTTKHGPSGDYVTPINNENFEPTKYEEPVDEEEEVDPFALFDSLMDEELDKVVEEEPAKEELSEPTPSEPTTEEDIEKEFAKGEISKEEEERLMTERILSAWGGNA